MTWYIDGFSLIKQLLPRMSPSPTRYPQVALDKHIVHSVIELDILGAFVATRRPRAPPKTPGRCGKADW
ncbi:MAG: hypothetical protein ACR2RB_16070, partial [Gammaproteobacteria bacterium]